VEETEKADSVFSTSIASAYRLSKRKLTLSDLNNELLGLHHILQLKRRLLKLGHEGCSTSHGNELGGQDNPLNDPEECD
jgi:hypothetical protein